MKYLKNLISNKTFIYLFYSLPIFFILGNLFVNIFIIIICLSFFFLKKEFEIVNKKVFYTLAILCIFFLISSFNSTYLEYSVLKSATYTRFFLFLMILPILIKKIDINFNKLGLSFLVIVFFVIFDTLIQLSFGKDIFGIPEFKSYNRLSGPFGDELIVGNFVFYFGFLGLALFSNNKSLDNYLLFFIFIIFGVFCFITGERNTFLSYLLFMILLFIFSKKKIVIVISTLTVILITLSLFLNFERFKNKYNPYLIATYKIDNLKSTNQKNDEVLENNNYDNFYVMELKDIIINSIWFSHYRAGIEIFEKNKLFGSGFKSFRYECRDMFSDIEQRDEEKIICSSHPHNMYIELLSDTGLFGFLFFLILILSFLYMSVKKNFFIKDFNVSIINCLFMTFIFPLKPHGSLFSTSSAFIFWLIFSFLIINSLKKN